MSIDADVLIVGAGPAGSAAAILLARRGVRVILVDRSKFPRDKPCGDYCDPGAVRVLEELKCLPDILAAGGVAISVMRVVAQDGTEFTAPFPNGGGLLWPRIQLDAVLVERAARAGATIVEGFRVDHAARTDDSVEIQRDRGRSMTGRLLIVADGMRSMTARRLGLYSELSGGRFTVGAYFAVSGAGPAGELHLGRGLYGGVAHFASDIANVCLALPRDRLKRHTPDQAFARAVAELPRLADELAGARRLSAFRCSGPVGFRASRVTADRVLLAGDAAMQIDPMTGQGIFFALRSGTLAAETAAAALSSGDLSSNALVPYLRRRAEEFGRKLTVAKLLQHLSLRPHLTPRLVGKLRARPDLATQMLGVTGDVMDPGRILMPQYVWRLLFSPSTQRVWDLGGRPNAPRA